MSILKCPVCSATLPIVRIPRSWGQAVWGEWTCPHCQWKFDRFGRKAGRVGIPQQTVTLSDTNTSTNPGGLALSTAKLRELRPDLFSPLQRLREMLHLVLPQRTYLKEQLLHGDSRAAVVVAVDPLLLVAAYTDELDCVAVLGFPDEFVEEYDLRVGSRLLTVNLYHDLPIFDEDLILGPNRFQRFTGFHPVIAEFLSDDVDLIHQHKVEITQEEWERAYRMGLAYLKQRPGFARDGRPVFASDPATKAY